MTILFAGGEDHDFTAVGTVTVETATTAARRSDYARCAMKVGGVATDGIRADFAATATDFWVTGRLYPAWNGVSSFSFYVLSLFDGSTRRLVLHPSTTSTTSACWRLSKMNAVGTLTTLQTSTTLFTATTLQKLDVHVEYGTSGRVRVYLGGVLIIDYSGDVTTDGATSLSAVMFGPTIASLSGGWAGWSEMIVATEDTRSMSLVTLAPAAAGATFDWTGAASDVNEVTLNDATLIASATANQVALMTVTNPGAIGSSTGVVALVASARAAKGGSGPTQAQFAVRTGGANYFGSSVALSSSLGRISTVFDVNPGTSAAWTAAQVTDAGFNAGIKSIA